MALRVAHASERPADHLMTMMPSVVIHAERIVSDEACRTDNSLLEGVASGLYHLWVACEEGSPDALLAMLVERRHHDATQVKFDRIARIAGSRMKPWRCCDQIEAWSAAQGATRIVAVGRRGWQQSEAPVR